MKKRILLLLMLFSIALTNAQTVGDLFTTDDLVYEVLSLTPNTVKVSNKNRGNDAGPPYNVPYPNATLTINTTVTDAATSTTYDVVEIQSDAFQGNTVIEHLIINQTTLPNSYRTFKGMTNLLDINMPNLTTGLTTAGNQVFMNCSKLTEINAPNFIGKMNNETFRGCSLLTDFNVPGVTVFNNNTFLNCYALTTINLPNLTTAGTQTFKNCKSLTTVNLPVLTNVGTQMFGGATVADSNQIVTLDLPLVTGIGNLGLWNCTKLENLNVPLVESVNRGAFSGCSALETLILPELTTMENFSYNFTGCTSLSHIALGKSTAIAASNVSFSDSPANRTLIVPNGSTANFSGTAPWSSFSIVEGTLSKDIATADLTYSRNLSVDDDWFLVSSPVSDEMYNDAYVAANDIDANGTGNNNAIATYVSGNAVGNKWSYMEDGQDLDFTPGVGYSVKRAASTGSGNISFTGSALNSGDVNNVPVSIAGDGYNVLGNPYLTNINSGAFLTANANLDGQIWLYNQATDSYDTHVTGDDYILAPAQGFFVKAISGTAVNFTEAIQNSTTATFKKTEISKIKLLINSRDTERYAKIYFTESATAGFDKGWDGETFTGVTNEFDVFTQLLEGNTGKNYQVQSLSDTSIEAAVVPVGLTSEAGKQITFSAETLNLPAGLGVYLEDRETNTFIRLDEESSKYEVTLSKSLNGVGRFFIHTSVKSALSVDGNLLETVNVYKLNNATLRIAGLSQGKASVKLFNVLGKQMMHTSFEANTSKDISLPKLETGIYIVQLETENGSLNKKIILE